MTVADVELVKEIMVKRADIFRDRGLLVSVSEFHLFVFDCCSITGSSQLPSQSIGDL